MQIIVALSILALSLPPLTGSSNDFGEALEVGHHHPKWLVNYPPEFHDRSIHTGELVDARNDSVVRKSFRTFCKQALQKVDGFTDGEVVDALEHYFWGQLNGLAMELGALDGSHNTRSMTFDYEQSFGWKRILVEGDPSYKQNLISNSPLAFSVNAAICEREAKVHFYNKGYVGGILEFMGQSFLKEYHGDVYRAGNPPGDLGSVNWSLFPHVQEVDCIPLSTVLSKAKVRHVNFFILDVEGGEMEVLRSINWSLVKFDVLCIETDPPNRPLNYSEQVTDFLAGHGYVNHSGQQGRNIWYTHQDFEPRMNPKVEMHPKCFDGFHKAKNVDDKYEDRNTPDFVSCEERYARKMARNEAATKPQE